MGVDVISENRSSLSFILTDAKVSLANAIRRAILGYVPTLAIEEVDFYDNTSSLYDEVLAHRLSLVPIVTDLELLNVREECKCEEGCPSCTLELSLKKKGPGNVYSQDLKSANKNFTPVPGILLAKLGKTQRIELKATAILGRARDNARWQSAVIGYKYYPVIDISSDCTNCGDCVEACPRNVFEIKKNKLKVTSERACILCRACVEACDAGAITITGDEHRFIYELETTGSLKPREILTRALDILIKKAEELSSKV
jgi:DNA-directed RNA polymerase subunit D